MRSTMYIQYIHIAIVHVIWTCTCACKGVLRMGSTMYIQYMYIHIALYMRYGHVHVWEYSSMCM